MHRTEIRKFVDRRLAIPDDSRRGLEDGTHAAFVAVLLASPTIFGMSDRDQVVDKIHRMNAGVPYPYLEPGIVEPGMADVEIKSALTAATSAEGRFQQTFDERRANSRQRVCKDPEQFVGILPIYNSAISPMLNDGLRVLAEVVEVSEANPVDSGRMAAGPAAPDQASYVEQ